MLWQKRHEVRKIAGPVKKSGQEEPGGSTYLCESAKIKQFYYKCMNCDIRPAPYGIYWRVFPRLEAIAVDEIMGGFPVVVYCKFSLWNMYCD